MFHIMEHIYVLIWQSDISRSEVKGHANRCHASRNVSATI